MEEAIIELALAEDTDRGHSCHHHGYPGGGPWLHEPDENSQTGNRKLFEIF